MSKELKIALIAAGATVLAALISTMSGWFEAQPAPTSAQSPTSIQQTSHGENTTQIGINQGDIQINPTQAKNEDE